MTATEKAQVLAKIDATIEAAKDARVLNVIEKYLMGYSHDLTQTDDIVFAIQEYLQDPSLKVQGGLRLLAYGAKLNNEFVLVQQIKNSPEFQLLVAENTPDETVSAISVHEAAKPEVVAVGTTAQAVATPKATKASKAPKTPKPTKATPKLPMPTIASIEVLEAMSRRELVQAAQALNHHALHTGITGKSASTLIKAALAHHILNSAYVAPASPAKAPKATKAKTQEIISLPEGLSWEECKGMKYRQLQQVCKALRSQGLFQGNIGGKGATGEALLKGCADYFRSQGVDIAEVTVSPSKTPIKELHLSNLARARKDAKLAKLAVAA